MLFLLGVCLFRDSGFGLLWLLLMSLVVLFLSAVHCFPDRSRVLVVVVVNLSH